MTQSATIDYGMRVHLDVPYDEAIERCDGRAQGRGVRRADPDRCQSTLKQKLDVDFRRYIILGACNPPLAYRAFSTELEIGLLLPCNVIVYEDESGEGSVVSIIDPIMMLGIGINPALSAVGEEASARLRRVLDVLQALD